jgi:transposase
MIQLWNHNPLLMEDSGYVYHDQITCRLGQGSHAGSPGRFRSLFFELLQTRFYATAAVCDPGLAAVLQDRLPGYHPDAQGLRGAAPDPEAEEDTPLLDALLCREAAAKKRAFENLLKATFERARKTHLIKNRPIGAIDATGLESRHVSRYYVDRKGYHRFLRRPWPKVTTVCDIYSHLFACCIVTRGPSNDSPEFKPALLQASRHVQFAVILADAAYDGEHNHRLCREELKIRRTYIALNKRRGRKWPKSYYRRQMKIQFDKELFNQRWQVESAFSQHKRLLGSALRGRTQHSRKCECLMRTLTHNLMIIRRAA